ncbi:MAG: CHAT domain-containing protein [Azoarcus sp.]|nr:CHAT domain-containing protein [Azoarcus sp.]
MQTSHADRSRHALGHRPHGVQIFLSYSSSHKDTAETLCCALQAVGHEVFFDREDLPPGQDYNDRIRHAIRDSDLFIFLITPEAVAPGHYTLTELKIASRKWPNPAGRVLPVMVAPTPFSSLPAYLSSVTVLEPVGNLAAEVALEVADLAASIEPAPAASPHPPPTTPLPDDQETGIRYQSLELRFSPGHDGRYPLALGSAADGSIGDTCPLDPAALEARLWAAPTAAAGEVRRGGAPVQTWLPSAADAREVGRQLYESLFAGPYRPLLDQHLRSIDPQRGEGLRFVINTTATPDLGRLPWEFIYSPAQDDFLFSDRMKPVVRWLDVDAPPPTLAVTPPLRLLIASAAPAGRPDLAVGEELAQLDTALGELAGGGLVQVTRLAHTSLESLDTALLQHRPHVLHFIGHGDFTGDDGMIVLEAENPRGAADPIAGRQLAILLRNHLASLRLVFLNSCMGATTSHRDPFGGVAQNLIRRGIPAVIAMQFAIPDQAAIALARHFYRYLAAGQPVDTALTSARAFLYARGYAVEWGAPALHMRAPDGRLFDIAAIPARTATPLTLPVAAPPTENRTAAPRTPTPTTPSLPPLSPPAAPPSGAQAATPRRRGRVWGVVAGAAALVLFAGWWLAMTGLESETPPADPAPIVVAPAPTPTPAPAPALPAPPLPAPAPEAEGYTRALSLLQQGADDDGLGQLDEALQLDDDLTALSALPTEQRTELATRLRAIAIQALAADQPGKAAGAAQMLMEIDPERPENLALLHEILAHFPTATLDPGASAGAEPLTPGAGTGMGSGMGSGSSAVSTYTVRHGDSLWRIAAHHYGDGSQWPRIFEANRPPLTDPNLVAPGQQLEILDPVATAYRVVPGDTLWHIAARFYGDPDQWPRIHAANRRTVINPDHIRPGQLLWLPTPH